MKRNRLTATDDEPQPKKQKLQNEAPDSMSANQLYTSALQLFLNSPKKYSEALPLLYQSASLNYPPSFVYLSLLAEDPTPFLEKVTENIKMYCEQSLH